MSFLDDVLEDLDAESNELDELVAALPSQEWATVTTAEGWTISHQIAHLLWTDEASVEAITDPDRFTDRYLRGDEAEAEAAVEQVTSDLAAQPCEELLTRWRRSRADLVGALRGVPAGQKLTWFGPPMSAASMATARLMETWAHSLDVWDALGLTKPLHDRVKSVCHLGVRTRTYAHAVRGLPAPESEVYVELEAPSGQMWHWGPPDATDRVTGSAWQFAMLATRRRHRDDVSVQARGKDADRWLSVIQAFAGHPGADPLPLAQRT